MDNYDSMTDVELQTEIAQREGWTEIVFSRPFLVGREPHNTQPNENRYIIPNWPQDVADALTLVRKSGIEEITLNFMDYECIADWCVFHDDERFNVRIQEEGAFGDPIARALTIAWLRWQDAQEDKS